MEAALALLVTGLGLVLLLQYLLAPSWCGSMNRTLTLLFGVAALVCSGSFGLLTLGRLGDSVWPAVQLAGALLGVAAGAAGIRIGLSLPREVAEPLLPLQLRVGRGVVVVLLVVVGDIALVWAGVADVPEARWAAAVTGLSVWVVAWAVGVRRRPPVPRQG